MGEAGEPSAAVAAREKAAAAAEVAVAVAVPGWKVPGKKDDGSTEAPSAMPLPPPLSAAPGLAGIFCGDDASRSAAASRAAAAAAAASAPGAPATRLRGREARSKRDPAPRSSRA